MTEIKHQNYQEELDHLNYTLEHVEQSLKDMIGKKESLDNQVDNIKRHYNSDNSQNYIDLMINTTLQESAKLKLKNLQVARSKPYFSRIDFLENGTKSTENLYIGKMSLMKEENQEIVIVDWRAPISNLYYEERLGQVKYNCPDGIISGELLLKRQFSIEGGTLNGIFDIDITTNDEFLQNYLGANANNRLKDIVSSIQSEQNKVIRADMWTPLIVQGAAGSGKTTIALHRIAYLIYTFEKSFKPENFMIIAPSRFFLNYISEVLPELGVERVKQCTFEDFALEIIGQKLKVLDSNIKLNSFVNHNVTEDQKNKNELIKKSSQIKASFYFKEILDEYIEKIEEAFIPKEDFKIDNITIFTYIEINNLFINQYKRLPIIKRIEEIKKHLTNRLKLKKDDIVNSLQSECDKKIGLIKYAMEESDERQKLIIATMDKKDEMVRKIEQYEKMAVKEYISKISKLNALEYYKELINDKEKFIKLFKNNIDETSIEFLREHSQNILNSGFVEIEDFAPIVYLKYKIYGVDEKMNVKHIVIDEAQDFSVFQLYVLKKIIDCSFTILGDLCQGIHSYRGIQDWNDVNKYVFEDKNKLLTLEQSYRTTVEIMDDANKVIEKIKDKNLTLAKPVIRHGEKVNKIKKESLKEIAEDISKKINDYKKDGYKSMAIICKTLDECLAMLSYFKKGENSPYILTGKEKEYKSGIVIVPSYLSKGLEFDAVFIANGNGEEYKEDELDIKLLYVSMTRSLHKLNIYYHGELSPLLMEV